MKSRVDFIGIPLDNISMSETLDRIENAIFSNKQIHHCVINAGKVVKMQSDKKLQESVINSDIINADGMSIIWAARLLGHKIKERVAGIDLMEILLTRTMNLGAIEFGILIILLGLLVMIIGLGSRRKHLFKKLDEIHKHINEIQKQVNFLSTEYGTIDKNITTSKDNLHILNETIRSIQKDIGQKNDENLSEQKINNAIDLAKLGLGVNEIVKRTGLSEEQIETLIKFHTQKT